MKANTNKITDAISEMEEKLFAMHPEAKRIYETLRSLNYFQKQHELELSQEKDLQNIAEKGVSNNN